MIAESRSRKLQMPSMTMHRNAERKLHREDGPAREHPDGTKEWCLNGQRHREDGPAVEWPDGTKEWWLNGRRHRKDGPALERSDGRKAWYLNGRLHREDGPAIEWLDGREDSCSWWLDGKYYTFEQWIKITDLKDSEKAELILVYG